jgi:hypothetical protein
MGVVGLVVARRGFNWEQSGYPVTRLTGRCCVPGVRPSSLPLHGSDLIRAYRLGLPVAATVHSRDRRGRNSPSSVPKARPAYSGEPGHLFPHRAATDGPDNQG